MAKVAKKRGAPQKACPKCSKKVHARTMTCPKCSHSFKGKAVKPSKVSVSRNGNYTAGEIKTAKGIIKLGGATDRMQKLVKVLV